MSFSSYAGYLVSLDDFYIMDRYMITHRKHNFFWEKWSERNTCAWRISHDDIWHWVYRSIPKYKRWASVGRIFMTNVLFWFSGLVMLQTTNDVFNTSLLKFVSSNSLLAWHRVRLANLMAHSGKEWSDVYKQYNSGRSFSLSCLGAELQCCESIHLGLQGFLGTKELLTGKYYLILG